MPRFHLPLCSAVVLSAAIVLAPGRADAQLWTAIGDVADIIKQDGDRFNSDIRKLKSDYKKFTKAQDLIDAQSKRTVELHKQTMDLIANLQTEVTAYDNKRPGLSPDKWGQDPDAVRDRARYAELKKQIEGLRAFEKAELANCTEAVKTAKKYTGTSRVSADIGTKSGTDEGWKRIKDKVAATIARCNEAANRVKQIETTSGQAILASPAEPVKIENTSDKMVFFVLTPMGADGARIAPKSKVSVAMPADRVIRLRAEAQTPMREKILVLGKRGGKTISVQTATQHELTYLSTTPEASATTTTKVTSEVCTWKVRALSKKVAPQTTAPMASTRYKTLKDDAIAWTIPPITAATFSKGISEPLMAEVTCNLEWLYERTGTGAFGSKSEKTPENQYGAVTIWVMPQ